uniref:Uncharacterized protein n=1 Tax=viral metagenome TaxID=1070528 RepID=A0A6M3INK8_9ZZZZ
MSEQDRLQKMLNGTKEDAPFSCGMFREFRDNHFNHLKSDVMMNRKLLWVILGAIIAASIVDKI